ncbi:MAG: response regulator transcription factor [Spirochaetales bacterium]|jgi:two-component system, OmpR family, response regulator ArlR|nr:response regulator transcription factor [Spirochaetales bacterium]
MRLLLAEDEKELSNALCMILRHDNYSVDAVYDGNEALNYITSGEYDAVILDIMMPGMNGINVLKEARRRGCATPVIILTAKAEIEDKVLGLDSGADDYLTKPFSSSELLARLRALSRRKSELTSNELKSGNITLNQATGVLSSSKGEFKLANKEFQMMQMLMVEPGRVIPTDRFMERIWGWDSDAQINVVWVYISYLRKKLTALESTAKIIASRSLGYSLEVPR